MLRNTEKQVFFNAETTPSFYGKLIPFLPYAYLRRKRGNRLLSAFVLGAYKPCFSVNKNNLNLVQFSRHPGIFQSFPLQLVIISECTEERSFLDLIKVAIDFPALNHSLAAMNSFCCCYKLGTGGFYKNIYKIS